MHTCFDYARCERGFTVRVLSAVSLRAVEEEMMRALDRELRYQKKPRRKQALDADFAAYQRERDWAETRVRAVFDRAGATLLVDDDDLNACVTVVPYTPCQYRLRSAWLRALRQRSLRLRARVSDLRTCPPSGIADMKLLVTCVAELPHEYMCE